MPFEVSQFLSRFKMSSCTPLIPEREDYASAKKGPSTSYDRALCTWGKIQIFLEILFWITWFVGIFPILFYHEDPPLVPLPGLPRQAYSTISGVDRVHWRTSAHLILLLAFFSLMTGRGGEMLWTQYFILFVVTTTDVYAVIESTTHLYADQHPDFRAYEMTLAIAGLIFTCMTVVWYTCVYVRFIKDGVRFDGMPSEEEKFKRRLDHYLDFDKNTRATSVAINRVTMK